MKFTFLKMALSLTIFIQMLAGMILKRFILHLHNMDNEMLDGTAIAAGNYAAQQFRLQNMNTFFDYNNTEAAVATHMGLTTFEFVKNNISSSNVTFNFTQASDGKGRVYITAGSSTMANFYNNTLNYDMPMYLSRQSGLGQKATINNLGANLYESATGSVPSGTCEIIRYNDAGHQNSSGTYAYVYFTENRQMVHKPIAYGADKVIIRSSSASEPDVDITALVYGSYNVSSDNLLGKL